MREFMTRIMDRWSERRQDPERREDRLAVVIVGAAAAVVIVALLLVLWGHLAKERSGGADDGLLATSYEEKMKEYMAQNEGKTSLWQEYAAKVEAMDGRVTELLGAMTQVEQNVSELIEQYREEGTAVQEKLTSLHAEIEAVVYELRETQTKLYDLTDVVQVMGEETIPIIREQIVQIQEEVEQVQGDIANLYMRVTALEQEDVRLWESIGGMKEIVDNMSALTLRYRYDEESGTLYLDPYGD